MKITNIEQLKKLIDILKTDYPDNDTKSLLDNTLETIDIWLIDSKISTEYIIKATCAELKEEFGLIGFNNALNKLV